MPPSNVCWGIEIRANAVKGLKLVADGDRVKVADFAIVPHAKILSSPDIDANEVLRLTLQTFAAQVELNKASIAISVPGHMGFARFAKLPPVEPKKVPAIVRFEAMQQIPFPLEEVEWDYQTFVSPDSPDVEVGIFAIRRENINQRLAMLQDVGITPDHVTLSPIAAYNALAYDLEFSEKTEGTILLDVGTTSSDLVVADAGRMWIRTFPLGGHQFTQALVDAFKVGYSKADKLKREAQDTAHSKQIFAAMRPVFTDLAQDVQRSIQYYQSLHKEAQLKRIIGVGSTFGLPGLRKYLKQQVGIEVYRVEEFKKLNPNDIDASRRQEFIDNSGSLVTAYGLALQGLGFETVRGNLMPAALIKEAMWKGKTKWFALGAGLAAALGGAMFIQPVMTYFGVEAAKASDASQIITAALSEANRKKTAANEAGVIGGAKTDFTAINLAGMLQNRDLYTHITNDLGAMFAQADQAAGQSPAYTLRSFTTRYGRPARDLGLGVQETGDSVEGIKPPDDLKGQPRITCTMVVSTSQPEPQKFMIDTIQRWLRENSSRPGVPYRILISDSPWTFQAGTALAATAAPLPDGEPPPTEERGGGSGKGAGGKGGSGQEGTSTPQGPHGSGIGSGPAVGASRDQEDTGTVRKAGSLASLGGAAPPPPTGTFTITWQAFILPPKKEEAK